MDAVKFLKVLDKMCDGKCRECEFGEKASRNEPCHYWRNAHPEETVAIVERWGAEHPVKTRQSEFLKHYPSASIVSGCLHACPKDLFANTNIDCNKTCLACKKDFWSAEVEE